MRGDRAACATIAHVLASEQTHGIQRPPHPALLCALIALVVLAVFGRAVTFPFLAFDDAELIVRNALVHGGGASLAERLLTRSVGYIIPITIAVERGLFAIAHGEAWPFHAMAVLLHALNACLVLLLALRFCAASAPAHVSALVFALHPLVVQPLAWAICLKDLLMAFFALGALHAFQSALRARESQLRWSLTTLALALASMLCKPTSSLLGFALLAMLVTRNAPEHAQATTVARATRLTALLVAGLGLLFGVVSRMAHDAVMGAERLPSWTPLFPLNVLGHHVQHALWPLELHIVYPDPSGGIELATAFGLAAVAAWVAAVLRVRDQPDQLGLLVLAAVSYLPVSNVLPFGRVMSDSYLYLPLAALAAALARFVTQHHASKFLVGAFALIALVLGGVSHAQLPRWRGGDALWQPVVRAYPALFRAHKLYADELVMRGDPKRGAERFVHAFEVGYDPSELLELGAVLSMAGRTADAECVLIEALLIGPESGKAAFNYAVLLTFQPDHTPRFPSVARRVIEDTESLRRAGKIAWPPALRAALEARARALASVEGTLPAWRPRSCAALQPSAH